MSTNEVAKKVYWRYGGQAVIEGVMMRSPRYFAIACRAPDGSIVQHSEPILNTWIGRLQFLNRPLLRGVFMLIDAIALGIRALNFSSLVQIEHDPAQKPIPKSLYDFAIGATMVVGIGLGLLLFFVLPTGLTELLHRHGWAGTDFEQNLMDGVIRIALFLGYVALIGLLPDIRRLFQYHGAEHKAINALEAGLPITIENARAQTRLHPRCGTSFVLLVLILSIFVFSLTGRPPLYLRLPLHLSLVPVIASVTYETIRLAGRFKHQWLTRVLLAPGLWSQYLTTREPSEDQIEVAVLSLQKVLELEGEQLTPAGLAV